MEFFKINNPIVTFILILFSLSLYGQDPGLPGTFGFEKLQYDLGDTFQPSDYQNTMVEVRAVVHRPTVASSEPFPLVIFLHGRHSTCYDQGSTNGQILYPCNDGQIEIPSHEGYDYLAELIASQGNIVVSISSNGILGTSGTSDYPSDDNALARAELIQKHLELWQEYNTSSNGPFGSDFIGKVDLQNIITIGHSRGGEGVVRHHIYNEYLSTPFVVKGVFAIAPTNFHNYKSENMNLATILPYCDGDLSDLQGLLYYDEHRYEYTNASNSYHNILMMGANHNYFNTVWTPGEYPAATGDDWGFQDQNQNNPFCGSNSSTSKRFSPEKQRNAIKPYIAAFIKEYTGRGDSNLDDILRGVNQQPPASSTLNPEDIHLSYQAPSVERSDVNRMSESSNTTTNTIGGAVTTSGLSLFESCGADNNFCGETDNLDNHFKNNNGVLSSLGRVRVEWNNTNGWYKNDIPVDNRNMSDFTHLTFRLAVNMNTGNTFINQNAQNFTVEITDGSNNSVQTLTTDHSKALFLPQGSGGNQSSTLPRSVSNTVAIPLSAFQGVDLSDIASFRFLFDQTSQGSLLISDIAFTSYICVPGLKCNDGDPCTTGETYDADCNCTGGTPSPNDSDNDGVCDEFDICPGGDDNVDTDYDGIPDHCDPCPLYPDTDGDGVCDDVDICPDGDDNANMDGDQFPDACDICPSDSENLCVPDGYCSSEPSVLFTYIDSVTFDGVVNQSGNDNGYGDYTATIHPVNAGDTYDLALVPEGSFGGGDMRWSVWVDSNRNAIFEASELVFSTPNASSSNVNTQITIPTDAINGGTRMRIAGIDTDTAPPPSCGSYIFGEVEDYALMISGGVTLNTDSIIDELVNFKMFPNPASNEVTLLYPSLSGNGKISIYDMSGKLLLEDTINDTGRKTIPLKLSSGLYLVEVTMKNRANKVVKKLIVE